MKKKDFRTIEYYERSAAEIRMLKTICLLLLDDIKLCPKSVTSKVTKLYSSIQETGYAIQDQMYIDNWRHTDERNFSMFNGVLTDGEIRNNVDLTIKKVAIEIMKNTLRKMEDEICSLKEQKVELRNSEVSDVFLLRQLRCERTFIESGLKDKYDEALRRVIEKEMKA